MASKFKRYVDEHLPRSVTLGELADRAEVQRAQLSRDLRQGLETAQTSRALRYAAALGCKVEDISGTEGITGNE